MRKTTPPDRPDIPDDVAGHRGDHGPERIEKFGILTGLMKENSPPEPHWYLNVLATHPDWQRQGFGVALMATVFPIAEEAGVPCYLETETLENVAYYRHHGFEVRTEWDVPLDGPHMWGMLRREGHTGDHGTD